MEVRAYHETDLLHMVRIWKQVVEDGVAFFPRGFPHEGRALQDICPYYNIL